MVEKFADKTAVVAGRRINLGACKALAHSRAGDVWLFRAPKGWYFLVILKAPPGWVKLIPALEALDVFNRMAVKLTARHEAFPPGELPEAAPPREGAIVHLDPQPRSGALWPRPETTVKVRAAIEPEEAAREYRIQDCVLLAHDHDHPRTPGTARFLFRAPSGEYFALRVADQLYTMKLDRSAAQIWWETMPTKAVDYEGAFGESPQDA